MSRIPLGWLKQAAAVVKYHLSLLPHGPSPTPMEVEYFIFNKYNQSLL